MQRDATSGSPLYAGDRSFPILPGLRLSMEILSTGSPFELTFAMDTRFPARSVEMVRDGFWVQLAVGNATVAVRFERCASLANEAVFRAAEWLPVSGATPVPEGVWLPPSGRPQAGPEAELPPS